MLKRIVCGILGVGAAAFAAQAGQNQQDVPREGTPLEDGTVQSYGEDRGACDCLDLALVIDDTGSMFGAIANVSAGIVDIVNLALAECGDVRAGVITHKDDVQVDQPFTANMALVIAAVNAIPAGTGGGAGEPEASDEALREAFTATVCALTGDFIPDWRSGCCKVAILVTDANPGGCDDLYQDGVDNVNAHQRALDALGLGINIGALFVPTFGDPGGTITPVMIDYAATTGGVFGQSNPDGSGTADAIEQVILNCSTGGATEFCCLPDGTCVEVLEGQCAGLGGFVVVDCVECPSPTIESSWGQIKARY
jgi:uncharacterized protein YegL